MHQAQPLYMPNGVHASNNYLLNKYTFRRAPENNEAVTARVARNTDALGNESLIAER